MGQAPVVAVLNFALRCGQGPPGGLLVVRLRLQLPRPGRRALAHVVIWHLETSLGCYRGGLSWGSVGLELVPGLPGVDT